MTGVHGTAAGYFAAMRAEYDSLIRRAVPSYDAMTTELVDCLPRRAARVLELGCGTGNFSLRLADRFPNATLTVVDASPEMVGVTRTRLRSSHPDVEGHARFVAARFEALRAGRVQFDLVTSCISLHHLAEVDHVFHVIHGVLRPGGTFRFADQMRGGTPGNHDRNWRRWLEFCRQPGHCSPEELQSLLDHSDAHDHYRTLRDHIASLEAAGFSSVDCTWRDGMWAIVTADVRAERPGRARHRSLERHRA